jgi:putative ABC transport system permease protein
VLTEIALSMVLLIGAGLFIRSLGRLLAVDPGFRPEKVLYTMVKPSQLRYANDEQKAAFYSQLQSRLESIPGVEKISLSGLLPMSSTSATIDGLYPEDKPEIPRDEWLMYESVGPGYFSTLGIPFLAGRDFSALDRHNSPPAAIINKVLA